MDAPFLADLLQPQAYPHPCVKIELVETHISWVLLTGDVAYKIKKPVNFGFVDFSSLGRRKHFCEEELRCNRRFAPELYVDVVALRYHEGRYEFGSKGEVVDHAVKMVQFDREQELGRLLDAKRVTPEDFAAFGRSIALQHEALPIGSDACLADPHHIWEPHQHNYDVLLADGLGERHCEAVARLRDWSRQLLRRNAGLFAARLNGGRYRECHGDLHLGNIVATDQGLRAFDCLEFDPALRWIDVINDVAFVFMDCWLHGRPDCGYAFIDGYLERSLDFEGLRLLRFYSVYRCLVRAKVATLRQREGSGEGLAANVSRHVAWADRFRSRSGCVILMSGLSGSGKSWLAERLVPRLRAIRLRSDLLRKQLAGLPAGADSNSGLNAGIYTADRSRAVYAELLDHAFALASAGERVIVDATYLDRACRNQAVRRCERAGLPVTVVVAEAPVAELERRIVSRAAAANDPSEATLDVLREQLETFERPGRDEHAVFVDTSASFDIEVLARKLLACSTS